MTAFSSEVIELAAQPFLGIGATINLSLAQVCYNQAMNRFLLVLVEPELDGDEARIKARVAELMKNQPPHTPT